jgi:hypothetical protein
MTCSRFGSSRETVLILLLRPSSLDGRKERPQVLNEVRFQRIGEKAGSMILSKLQGVKKLTLRARQSMHGRKALTGLVSVKDRGTKTPEIAERPIAEPPIAMLVGSP